MIILLLTLITLLLIMVIYALRIIHQFSFIKKIENKWISWFLSCIPILIILLFFNIVDFVAIIIHFIIFYGIAKIIILILNKTNKKNFSFYFEGVLAITLTTIYLSIGAYLDYHVFETVYNLQTTKDLGSDNFRIIQLSDVHLGATFDGNGFKKHLEKIKEIPQDIVVITGDFVDDSTTKQDMIEGCHALSILNPQYGIYFIYGNHDEGYFNSREFSKEDLENELEKNNVTILKDDIKIINDNIYLIGRKDKGMARKTIQELVEDIPKDKFIIDLNHQPNDYKNEMNNVDLVLSGHTHGGQMIPLGLIGTMIGSNDKTYGLEKRENTYFIVSSGISNWELSFKTGTKSEYVIINITKSA